MSNRIPHSDDTPTPWLRRVAVVVLILFGSTLVGAGSVGCKPEEDEESLLWVQREKQVLEQSKTYPAFAKVLTGLLEEARKIRGQALTIKDPEKRAEFASKANKTLDVELTRDLREIDTIMRRLREIQRGGRELELGREDRTRLNNLQRDANEAARLTRRTLAAAKPESQEDAQALVLETKQKLEIEFKQLERSYKAYRGKSRPAPAP